MQATVKFVLPIISAMWLCHLPAQKDNAANRFYLFEDSMKVVVPLILNDPDENERTKVNEKLLHALQVLLSDPASFDYPFDSLGSISRIYSGDRRVRIFSWNMPLPDGTFRYFGFIQAITEKRSSAELFLLEDKSEMLDKAEYKITGSGNWYGTHYYDIIPCKINKERHYVLLGMDWNTPRSNKKIIEILHFNKEGKPVFGAPVFEHVPVNKCRVIFEYADDAFMSLRYDKKKKRIVFDHLSPIRPSAEGSYSQYIPDLSYDAYAFKRKRWIYRKDVDARNDLTGIQMKKYRRPE